MHRNKWDNWITIKLWIIWTLSRFILEYLSTRSLLLKRPELSKKVVKILKYGLKASLSVRFGSRKPKKGVQNALEHKSAFGVQKYHLALLECWMALSKCRMALAQLFSSADKAHPFWLFHRKTRPDSHSTHRCLFYKPSILYI